jgi:hypothetical protein
LNQVDEAVDGCKEVIEMGNIPALLNQLLARVDSAARPSSKAWEKNFMLNRVLVFRLSFQYVNLPEDSRRSI